MNKIKLNHLYSQNLNIYGDLGNIIALQYHSKNLGIELQIVHTEIGDKITEADIYFIGGGQDEDQMLVFKDLLKHKEFLAKEVEAEKVFLLVCGGYQLFGNYFIDSLGNRLEGLGILDMETKALDEKVSSRCIGNVVVEMNTEFIDQWNIESGFSKYLVGFENHGGQTYLNSRIKTQSLKLLPLGKVLVGFGNNSNEKFEGCCYKNVIGTYLHGSLLPKNPHLARAILAKVLKIKISAEDLDLEKEAHLKILQELGI